jgi:hypothetical protein
VVLFVCLFVCCCCLSVCCYLLLVYKPFIVAVVSLSTSPPVSAAASYVSASVGASVGASVAASAGGDKAEDSMQESPGLPGIIGYTHRRDAMKVEEEWLEALEENLGQQSPSQSCAGESSQQLPDESETVPGLVCKLFYKLYD